jgi:hypothetical protein
VPPLCCKIQREGEGGQHLSPVPLLHLCLIWS